LLSIAKYCGHSIAKYCKVLQSIPKLNQLKFNEKYKKLKIQSIAKYN
jgi:hypothetical protein